MLFFLSLILLIPQAQAKSECGWNDSRTFFSCDDVSKASTGATIPIIGDILQNNPAGLPSFPTPLGVEGTFSNRSFPGKKAKFSASLIKGFEGIGFGLGSWSDGTFSAPDFRNHFYSTTEEVDYKAYEANPPSDLGLRLGTSVKIPPRFIPRGIDFSVGGSVGFSRVKNSYSPQFGAVLRLLDIRLGYSRSFDRISTLLPKARVDVASIGLDLGAFYLGYSYVLTRTIVNRTHANNYLLRLDSGRWVIFGAVKLQKDHRGDSFTWPTAGIQRKLGSRLGVGYVYGLYRYSHSALLQFYF